MIRFSAALFLTPSFAVAYEIVNNFAASTSEIANQFYQQYLLSLLGDVFFVLTDADHKSGLKMQGMLLAQLIALVESGAVQAPLFDPAQVTDPGINNVIFLKGYISDLLSNAFGHVQPAQIASFVNLMFETAADHNKFKLTIRDFLISLKEFSGDNAELYIDEREAEAERREREQREAASRVPGMLKPAQIEDDTEL